VNDRYSCVDCKKIVLTEINEFTLEIGKYLYDDLVYRMRSGYWNTVDFFINLFVFKACEMVSAGISWQQSARSFPQITQTGILCSKCVGPRQN